MSSKSTEYQMFALIGGCLLCVQQAEHVLASAVLSVLKDRTLTADKLMVQTEKERKRTLGAFLKELKQRARIEPNFDQKLWRFLEMRNTFVHNLSEVPGWNLRTQKGRAIARMFLVELSMLAVGMTCVFLSLFIVSAKDEFGKDLTEGDEDMAGQLLEKHFGTTARKILAGRYRKPVLVHSRDNR